MAEQQRCWQRLLHHWPRYEGRQMKKDSNYSSMAGGVLVTKNIAVALASRCNRLYKSPGLRSSDLPGACVRTERRIIETEASRSDAKSSWHSRASICIMPVVLCNDSEIEVDDGEICQICGQVLEEFDEVTGTGIHGYYHWTCVCHTDA